MVGDVVYVGVVPIERKIIHRLVTLYVQYMYARNAHKVPSNGIISASSLATGLLVATLEVDAGQGEPDEGVRRGPGGPPHTGD